MTVFWKKWVVNKKSVSKLQCSAEGRDGNSGLSYHEVRKNWLWEIKIQLYYLLILLCIYVKLCLPQPQLTQTGYLCTIFNQLHYSLISWTSKVSLVSIHSGKKGEKKWKLEYISNYWPKDVAFTSANLTQKLMFRNSSIMNF